MLFTVVVEAELSRDSPPAKLKPFGPLVLDDDIRAEIVGDLTVDDTLTVNFIC